MLPHPIARSVARSIAIAPLAIAVLIGPVIVGAASGPHADQTLRNEYPGAALPGLSASDVERFDAGSAVFSKLWRAEDGLGPRFNSNSCATCHHNPLPGGNEFAPARFVAHSNACIDAIDGRSCAQFEFGADRVIHRRVLPQDVTFRKPQSLYGLGMLEAVSDQDILELAAVQKSDPDGVHGKPGRTNDGRIARFGWKARFADIDGFVAAAFRVEMGLTSERYPGREDRGERAQAIDHTTIRSTGDFVRMLAAPPLTPRGDVTGGRALFETLRCNVCHVQTLRTSQSSLAILTGRRFVPYTDLLVHDMGKDLSDQIVEGDAGGSSFRTPPLWGLNASGPPFLHDGRAKSVIEAILLHGGEASAAKQRFSRLRADEIDMLLLFLSSI